MAANVSGGRAAERERASGFPWAAGVVAALAIAAACWPETALMRGELERGAWENGQVWRWWTAHVVHYGASHFAWNLSVWLVAATWLERIRPWVLRGIVIAGAPVLAAGILVLERELGRYAGLSGLATATVVALALMMLREAKKRKWVWWSVLAAIGLKIATEACLDATLLAEFERAEIRNVPLAHGLGAAVGAVAWGIETIWGKRKT